MRKFFPVVLATTIGALFAAPAVAANAFGTLTFSVPSGTVGPLDQIPVSVTFQLDANSSPITTDEFGRITSGFDLAELPQGFTVSSSNLNVSFQCSGTFTTGCDGPPYDFSFASTNSFSNSSSLNLQPGSTTHWQFGTFSPSNATPVAQGTYTFYNAEFFMQLYDDSQPNAQDTGPLQFDVSIANTCVSQDSSCSFQRTVTAVPEPETYAMLLAGLVVIGSIARRRSV